jgi:hypothetical protein
VAVGAEINATVAETGAVAPPAPVHIREYTVVAVMGAVVCVPLAASVPLQPPEAVQESASVELQVSDALRPSATAPADAVRVAVGSGFTVTAALTGALAPSRPEQVNTKFASPLNAPLLWLPLVASVPLQLPEPVQEVACAELHVSVESLPSGITLGLAVSCTVGNALTTMASVAGSLVPAGPEHVSV